MKAIRIIATHQHSNANRHDNNAYCNANTAAMYSASWNKMAFISKSEIVEPRFVGTILDLQPEGGT